MTLQEGIEKLKGLIEKFNVTPEPIVTTEQKFTDAKLQTGEVIQYDAPELSQGAVVNLVTPEGILPIPDGEYVLEDGAKLVTSGGLVAEYVPAEPLAEGEVADTATPEATAQTTPMETTTAPKRVIKSQVEEHVFSLEIEGIEPIKVDFSSMFKALKDENAKLLEMNKEMFAVVKSLSDEPATAPTEKAKVLFSSKKDFQEVKEAFKKLTK